MAELTIKNNTSKILESSIDASYNQLSREEKERIYSIFRNPEVFDKYQNSLEKLIFKKKPPTPTEFITIPEEEGGWLPKRILDGIFPYIKDEFIEILNVDKNYFQISSYGGTRIGKCEGKDTPILMYDLSIKKIQDIEVGDLLMGDDSKPRRVLKLHKGFGKLYKVKQNKADDYIVNENHILTLQYTNKGMRKERNNLPDKDNGKIIDICLQDYLKLNKSKKHRLKGIKAKIDFEQQDVLVDPYFLGLWLGDGCEYHTGITTMDEETKDFIYDYANSLNLKVSIIDEKNKSNSYRIVGSTCGNHLIKSNNTLLNYLKYNYNLIRNKHIPIEYLRNSEEVRLQLLAGLLDSDGHLNKTGDCFEISQSRKSLADQICFLGRSLGFRVSLKTKKTNYNTLAYRCLLTGDLYKIPTKIKRKQSNAYSNTNPLRTGIKIEEFGEGEFFGFELDGNQRYLHSDLTITHNTFEVRLIIIYIIVYFHHLRDAGMFFGVSSLTEFCVYLISFKFEKTEQLYLRPIFKILEQCNRFKKVKSKDDVLNRQKEWGMDTIVYSTASTTGEITLASGLQIHMGNNDSLAFIGADIIFAVVSEIAFFIKEAGATEDDIFELYTNLLDRIDGTLGKDKYLAMVYLDSSANDADSKIENHIIKVLQHDEECYFTWKSRWEARPDLFKKWNERRLQLLAEKPYESLKELYDDLYNEGFMFEVITGNGQIKASIVENEKQKEGIPKDLIIRVPIDAKSKFETQLIKSIKDIAGRPSSKENKFITDQRIISNLFSNDTLIDHDFAYIIGSEKEPDKLIWDKVKSRYFKLDTDGRYFFPRATHAYRYIGIDSAYSKQGDMASIVVGHLEWSEEREVKVYVADMIITIKPSKEGINLASFEYFVYNLMYEGNLSIHSVSSDSFESETLKQNLKRMKVDMVKNSIDKTINPYMRVLTGLQTNTIKCGYSHFLENNLSCLEIVQTDSGKDKVDHPKGNDTAEGLYGKDTSDGLCQSFYTAIMTNEQPQYIYEEENKKFSDKKEDICHVVAIGKANIIASLGSVLRI